MAETTKKQPKPPKKKKPIEVVGSEEEAMAESKRAAIHWDPRAWRRLDEGSW